MSGICFGSTLFHTVLLVAEIVDFFRVKLPLFCIGKRGFFLKALITAPFDENELQRLSKVVEVTYENWRETGKVYMDGDEFSEHLKHGNYEILIVEADEIDESVLSLEPLKLVASCRSNPVNVEIDIATQKGVCVLNTPHRNADAVADLTIALILSSVRKVTEVNIFLRQNPDFELEDEEEMSSFFRKFTGFELGGKTVGIVGFGGIGSRVANRLHFGFDMKILVYDPFVKEEDPQLKKVKGVLVSLNDLLRQSDVVTVHAMPTPGSAYGGHSCPLPLPHITNGVTNEIDRLSIEFPFEGPQAFCFAAFWI